ncbi:hypothetical protein EDB89DRAFT_1521004 [Lactarius sanguifluus]|nr:hypothetical protein EDB89DRAFT_1521004 [Lactarius sanguifluus]
MRKGKNHPPVRTPNLAPNAQHRQPVEDEVLNGQRTDGQSSQDIVDKLQEKTEKEIVRTVKAIETERQFSDTFPLLDLDMSIVYEILALARDSQHGKANISDHTALTRLGITYGILRLSDIQRNSWNVAFISLIESILKKLMSPQDVI